MYTECKDVASVVVVLVAEIGGSILCDFRVCMLFAALFLSTGCAKESGMAPSAIRIALEQYEVDNGHFPSELRDLLKSNLVNGVYKGPYITCNGSWSKVVPPDEFGNAFGYYVTNTSAVVIYTGNDKQRHELVVSGF